MQIKLSLHTAQFRPVSMLTEVIVDRLHSTCRH